MTTLTRSFAIATLCLAWADVRASEKPAEKKTVQLEFRAAETEPAEGLTEAVDPFDGKKIYLHKTAEITNADIADARSTEDGMGRPAVSVTFTAEGGKKMKKFTERRLDKRMAILIDGKVVSAPTVRSTIAEKGMISGKFSQEEVDRLVKALKTK